MVELKMDRVDKKKKECYYKKHYHDLKFYIVEIGARKGLIGKSGVIPARSRHCNEEQTHVMPLGRMSWEGLGE